MVWMMIRPLQLPRGEFLTLMSSGNVWKSSFSSFNQSLWTLFLYTFFCLTFLLKLANQLHIKYVFLHERPCVDMCWSNGAIDESEIVHRTIAVKLLSIHEYTWDDCPFVFREWWLFLNRVGFLSFWVSPVALTNDTDQPFSTLVLRAPIHLIQMNGSLSSSTEAW